MKIKNHLKGGKNIEGVQTPPSFERNQIETFQRYKDYLFQPKLQISKEILYDDEDYPEDTQIVMMPYTANYPRSKTADAKNRIAFKNIGYQDSRNFNPQQEMKKKRNIYSRETMQSMNKKFRQIRSTQYGTSKGMYQSSAALPVKKSITSRKDFFQNDSNSDKFKLTGSAANIGFSDLANSFSHKNLGKKLPLSSQNMRSRKGLISQDGIRRKLGISQQNNEKCWMNPQKNNLQQNGYYEQKRQNKQKILKNHKKQQQNNRDDDDLIDKKLGNTAIQPSSKAFRTTLKQRHIDDNPKVLANILKKKSEFLSQQQMHEYIFSLMTKTS